MGQFHIYLNEILDFLRQGFAHVNTILGLFIALFASFQLVRWRALWEVALAAMLVHIVVTALMAPIHLPPLVDLGFWRDTLALYLGYVIVISAFFFTRTRLFKNEAKH